MEIRKARPEELERLMELFEHGKSIMRQSGNHHQWTGGYPSRELVAGEIAAGDSYVCIDNEDAIVGTFSFYEGGEPTYSSIYNGEWLDDSRPYGVIHRLASTPDSHGVAEACFRWCGERNPNLRADTHRDNHIVQRLLQKHGFSYCGIIYLQNGDERLAYQRT